MASSFAWEIVTRFFYFLGLGELLRGVGGDIWLGLPVIVVAWFLFTLTAQISQIVWSQADKRVIFLSAGNTLVQTILAAVVWYYVFQV